MTSSFRELVNKSNYSSVFVGQEGYKEHRGLAYNPEDKRAFSSKEEIDSYLQQLFDMEDQLTKKA